MRKNIFLISTIGLFALLATSCDEQKPKEEKNVSTTEVSSSITVLKSQIDAMNMEITPLQEKNMDVTIKTTGNVSLPPNYLAKVTSYIDGYVKPFNLSVGDMVKKGEPLLKLENPDFLDIQQSYLEVLEQLDYLESEYNRQQTLYNDKISSEKVFLKAKSDYKQALARYESLNKKLEMLHIDTDNVKRGNMTSYITIYAPISGYITSININPGMAVASSEVMMEIIEPKEMYLTLNVFESDFHSVHKGQLLRFSVPQVDDKLYGGEIIQIAKSVIGNDKIITVYASIEEAAKEQLLIGMFIDADIIKSSKMVLNIPFDAVITENGNSYVLALKEQNKESYIFERLKVKLGDRVGDTVNLELEGIPNNTNILSKGVYDVI